MCSLVVVVVVVAGPARREPTAISSAISKSVSHSGAAAVCVSFCRKSEREICTRTQRLDLAGSATEVVYILQPDC